MRRKSLLMLVAVVSLALMAASANAGLYTETFSGDGSGALMGTTVGGTAGDATWLASDSGTLSDNGTITPANINGSVYHAFTVVNGESYKFSVTAKYTGTYWTMIGFAREGFPPDNTFDRLNSSRSYANGYLYLTNAQVLSRAPDPGAPGATSTGAEIASEASVTTLTGKDYTFEIVLATDADGSSYTLTYAVIDGATTYDLGSVTVSGSAAADIKYAVYSIRNPAAGNNVSDWNIEVYERPFAFNPDPSNGAGSVELDLSARTVSGKLSWTAPEAYTGATYDVYFGDTEPNFAAVNYGVTWTKLNASAPQVATSIAPTLPLVDNKTHYWIVDSHEPNTVGTILHPGNTWSFTTVQLDAVPVVTTGDSYNTWLAEIQATPQGLAGTVNDFGEGDVGLAGIDWTISAYPGNPVNNVARLARRNEGSGPGIEYTAAEMAELVALGNDPNFLDDWIGTDTRDYSGNPLTLKLSGLSSGTYTWNSTHHDMASQTGLFDVAIDGVSKGTFDISDSNQVPTVFNTTFNADGVNPVRIVFDQQSTDLSVSLFVMNGFELTGGTDTLKVDFGPDPNFAAIGYQSYTATDRNLASFTAQPFTAGAMTVTVDPEWGPQAAGWINATLADTSTDPLNPTATLTTDYAGNYVITLTATETSGNAPDQSDSDTLTVRVAADACAAAKLNGAALNVFDDDENCVVGLSDLAAFAVEWLKDVRLTAPAPY